MSDAARYLRQILVAGVGREGQVRLQRTTARLPRSLTPLAREVAERYLRGAGVREVEPGGLAPGAEAARAAGIELGPAPREVLLGARVAQRELLLALGHTQASRVARDR